jgi:hypothetical protein
MADPAPRIRFQSDAWERVERAAEVAGVDDPKEFVREGALRFVDETIDEDGQLECPHNDCDRTFATIRQRRGHLGNVHTDVFPEGDYWCGYCGYGPTTWRGVNAHHGSTDHEGDPIRLESEPDEEDLIAPDDVPDHKDPDQLAELYEEYDGSYTEMCRNHDFDVGPGRVRHYLVEFGIHEVTPQGEAEDGEPVYRDPEWAQERYDEAGGNISEMHRQAQQDGYEIPYRTLLKNLKRFDIHDPESHVDDDDSEGVFECHECDYETDSERGLKIHISRSHDSADESDEDDLTATDENESEVSESQPHSETQVADVDGGDQERTYEDVAPEWLDEASFWQAVEMADDLEGFGDVLGWEDYEVLDELIQVTNAGEDLPAYEPGVVA